MRACSILKGNTSSNFRGQDIYAHSHMIRTADTKVSRRIKGYDVVKGTICIRLLAQWKEVRREKSGREKMNEDSGKKKKTLLPIE